ncbi:MAG: bifunctional hydroxymethylpyrimidine kinase/phosphomethylpyrimidine kinase [Tagaea sp.]|nr:bifunctional hydroxymethylpyrimidine kinase/phosphomethylpyrimidine kinase [Tagaea sp.]
MQGRVLIVAGSDSGGGAGIQADIKTVTAHAAYAATAITALTAQDTHGVHGVHPVPSAFIAQQIRVVMRDIGADAIKTGMLHDAATIDAVADALEAEAAGVKLVVDPVMYAKGGHPLLQPEAVNTFKRRMLVLATIVTPNLPEAEALSGMTIRDAKEMRYAAQTMLTLGCPAVLLKGGHLEGDDLIDVLATADGTVTFESPRIKTRATHGTGCTLASAIAACLAQKLDLETAVARARHYVQRAIEKAPGLGGGHGPLNHAHTFER